MANANIISFTATPNVIISGNSSQLAWTTTDTATVIIDHGVGLHNANDSIFVAPVVDTTYELTAYPFNSTEIFPTPPPITGVTIDTSNNLFYLTDTTVYELTANSGYSNINQLIAGNISFDNPGGIAIDSGGNLYIGGHFDSTVYQIPINANYSTANILGGGYSFSTPIGVATDSEDNLYVMDYVNGVIELYASNSYSNANVIINPGIGYSGIVVDSNYNVYISSASAFTILQYTAASGYSSYNVIDPGFTAYPLSMTIDDEDNIYVGLDSYQDLNCVYELTASSGYSDAILINQGGISLSFISGIIINNTNTDLFVAGYLGNSLQGGILDISLLDPYDFANVTVNVITITPPVITFTATPNVILLGASSVLSWDVTNAISASIDNGIGNIPLVGTMDVTPLANITYTLSATSNSSGMASADASIIVTLPIPLPYIPAVTSPATLTIGANRDGLNPFAGKFGDFRITKGLARHVQSITANTIIESNLSNILTGTFPADIVIDGGGFADSISSYSPEELIMGQIFDTCQITVYQKENPVSNANVSTANTALAFTIFKPSILVGPINSYEFNSSNLNSFLVPWNYLESSDASITSNSISIPADEWSINDNTLTLANISYYSNIVVTATGPTSYYVIGANSTAYLTSNLYANSNAIILSNTDPFITPIPALNMRGQIFINQELISYLYIDRTHNILSGLIRGVDGTGTPSVQPANSNVISACSDRNLQNLSNLDPGRLWWYSGTPNTSLQNTNSAISSILVNAWL